MADCCGGETKLIYACSGAANVGEIADRVARKLSSEENYLMSCLAGVGAGSDVEAVVPVEGCFIIRNLVHPDAGKK